MALWLKIGKTVFYKILAHGRSNEMFSIRIAYGDRFRKYDAKRPWTFFFWSPHMTIPLSMTLLRALRTASVLSFSSASTSSSMFLSSMLFSSTTFSSSEEDQRLEILLKVSCKSYMPKISFFTEFETSGVHVVRTFGASKGWMRECTNSIFWFLLLFYSDNNGWTCDFWHVGCLVRCPALPNEALLK